MPLVERSLTIDGEAWKFEVSRDPVAVTTGRKPTEKDDQLEVTFCRASAPEKKYKEMVYASRPEDVTDAHLREVVEIVLDEEE